MLIFVIYLCRTKVSVSPSPFPSLFLFLLLANRSNDLHLIRENYGYDLRQKCSYNS